MALNADNKNRPGINNFDKEETYDISDVSVDRELPDNWPWPVIEDKVGSGSGSGGSSDTGDFANSKIGNGLNKDGKVISVDSDSLLSDVNSRLDDLGERVGDAEDLIFDAESRLDRTDGRLDKVEGDIEDVKGRLDSTDDRLDKVEQDLSEVQKDVSDTKQGLEDTRKDLEDAKKDLEDVKQDVTNVQQNVTNVENNITNLQQTIENVQENIENISTNVLDEYDLVLYDKDGKIASKISMEYAQATGVLTLIGHDGSSVIGTVTIPSVGSFLESAKVVNGLDEAQGEGTFIKLVFRLSSGETSTSYVDVTSLVDIYTDGDGIHVNKREINILLAPTKSYLNFDETTKGLKVDSDTLFEDYMGEGLAKGEDGKYKVTLTSGDLEGIGGDFINATVGDYLSKNGSQIDVDKDGILSEVKNRIEDVDSKATQASSDAASAKTDAEEAKSEVAGALAAATLASQKADDAKQEAESARGVADEAKGVAESAKQTADGIAQTVTEAKQEAENAKQTAEDAKSTAEGVDAKAEDAKSTAGEAKNAADLASSTASDAKGIAEEAKRIAEGLVSGDVYTEGPGIAIDGDTNEISTRLKEKGGILVGEDGAMYIDPAYAKPSYDYESGPSLDYLIPFPESMGDLNVTETDYRVPVSAITDHVTMTVDNLTIGVGRTLTPESACSGLFIRVLGNLTVHGTISMTARGANVAGKNIYIDKSTKKIYAHESDLTEILPDGDYTTISARGGVGVVGSSSPGVNGACGSGGGGSTVVGGTGTSFSGGSGAGGDSFGTGTGNRSYGYAPTGNTGRGGSGAWSGVDTPITVGGGGAGNPGGVAPGGSAVNTGATGTGGLLVIIVDGDVFISSTGSIVSNGSAGGAGGSFAYSLAAYGGSGSGGGAIHILFSGRFSDDSKTRVRAVGGAGGAGAGSNAATRVGVAGGAGTVNFVNISSSGFVPGGGSPTLKSGGGIKISKEESEEEDTNTFVISTKLGKDGGLRINDNDELEFDSVLLPMAFDSVYTESNDPVVIGVWKDSDGNKHNVYRRYIEFTVPSTEDAKVSIVSTGGWNIDKVIRIYGYLKHPDGRYLPLDFVGVSNRITVFYNPETEQIALIQSGLENSPAYGFVEYTTKTDTPVKMPAPVAVIYRSDDYSLDEKYIGTWHDGKPLFRKGKLIENLPAGDVGASAVEKFFDGTGVFVEGVLIGNDGTIVPTGYNTVSDYVSVYLNNNTVKYNMLGMGAIKEGGSFLVFAYYTKDVTAPVVTDKYHVYSTEEKIVGEWYDGSLIYEKTFIGTTPAYSSTIELVPNVRAVIGVEGFTKVSNGNVLQIPYSDKLYVYSYRGNSARIITNDASYANQYFEVCIRYIKEDAQSASTLDLPVGSVKVETPTVELPKDTSIAFIPNFEPTGEVE